jgi:ankyrin repeat protein
MCRPEVAGGVSVGCSNYDGRTALMLAAAEGHLEVVAALVAGGADIGVSDRFGTCALVRDLSMASTHGTLVWGLVCGAGAYARS